MTRTLPLEIPILSLFLALMPGPALAQWTEDGVPVTTAPGNQRYPSMVSDGQGGVFIAWLDANSPQSFFLQRVGPDGRAAAGWPIGGFSVGASCLDAAPRMASDDAGGVYVAWCGSNPASGSYLQRVTGSGTIASGWPAGGLQLPFVPYLGTPVGDGAGGVFVHWTSTRTYIDGDGIERHVTDLHLQRLIPSGAVAPGWAADGTVVAGTEGPFDEASILPDGQGGLLLGYVFHSGGAFHVSRSYLQRVDGSGNRSYAAVLGCSFDTEYSTQISTYPTGSGGAIVGFKEFTRFSTFIQNTLMQIDEHGQRLTGWAPACQPFFSATALSRPLIVGDGGTGAFFAWPDTRNSPEADLYALRLDAAGLPAAGWSSAGVAACAAPGNQTGGLQMIPDGVGGAILAWMDNRAGAGASALDIYAQRLGPNGPGVAGWPVTGLPVCTAPNAQQAIQLVSDGVGGAFVCWEDFRSGTADIYVYRLGPGGPVPVLVSVASTEVDSDRVRIAWYLGETFAGKISILKRDADGEWTVQGPALPDGNGRIEYEDRAVRPGGRYGYRLEFMETGEAEFAGEVWVDVPSPASRLGSLSPNPTAHGWTVSLSLLGGSAATLDVMDIQGRIVMTREVGPLGAGQHQVPLSVRSALPAGVYTLRLTQAGRTATARGLIVR